MLTPTEAVLKGLLHRKTASLSVYESGEERGRGVITEEPLLRHEYVCEYCTHAIHFDDDSLEKSTSEYDINGEGSYILSTYCNGQMLHFDATRRYQQYGRYINHAR